MNTHSPNQRLVFIDIARSLAILLMLEGHFIALTLSEDYKSTDFFFYNLWQTIRCITAPLFFTITGLVFTYLLSAEKDVAFWRNKRLRKGIRRSAVLLLWGYALLLNIYILIDGRLGGYALIFHVLQCIGMCIALIIILFILQRTIRLIPFSVLLFAAGLLSFALKPTMYSLDFSSVHPAIENIFVITNADRAFKSAFPLFPWMGYALLGAALGAYVRKFPHHVYTNWFPCTLLVVAVLFNTAHNHIMGLFEPALTSTGALPFASTGYYLSLFGRVLAILAIIILVGKHKRHLSTFIHERVSVLSGWIPAIVLLVSGFALVIADYYASGKMITPTLSLSALGQFILLCGLIFGLSKLIPWNYALFLKIGQNTLSVFIIHVILLYGAIIGFGLDSILKGTLSPWTSMLAMVGFLLLFVYYVKYLDFFERLVRFKWLKRK